MRRKRENDAVARTMAVLKLGWFQLQLAQLQPNILHATLMLYLEQWLCEVACHFSPQ